MLDTTQYTKQEDGSFSRIVTHQEITTDLDNNIKVSLLRINEIETKLGEAQTTVDTLTKELAAEQANQDTLQIQNESRIVSKKTSTEETDNIDVEKEVAYLKATITNVQAGKTDNSDAQAAANALVTNLQEGLAILEQG